MSNRNRGARRAFTGVVLLVFGLAAALGSAASSALADGSGPLVVCWGRAAGLECSLGKTEEEAAQYCRSQCRYWAGSPAEKDECHEVWRCNTPGWAGVASQNKSIVTTVCGGSTQQDVYNKLRDSCKTCNASTYLVATPAPSADAGPSPDADTCRIVCDHWDTVGGKYVCTESHEVGGCKVRIPPTKIGVAGPRE